MAHLAELAVENVRSIATARLEFSSRSNLIYGANGAGKTSLLEAAFLLGRGRSFRTRLNERLVRLGEESLTVFGRVRSEDLDRSLGVEVTRASGSRARLDGSNASGFTDLATAFPVQILDPELHRLVEDGAGVRRRWLDWAVFHVEPQFASHWARYRRALRQRNAALCAGGQHVQIWDAELVQAGESLSTARRRVFEALLPHWTRLSSTLIGADVSMALHQGWDRTLGLAEALQAASARDGERQTTSVGPHRAEIALRLGVRSARDVLSRGQQKLAGACLVLCQLEYLKHSQGLVPTLLLDDPSAELDATHLEAFIERVASIGGQLIVTALGRDFSLFGRPETVFHVEQGRVSAVY